MVKVDEGNTVKLKINENDYIKFDQDRGSIDIKCGDDFLQFDSLKEMIGHFKPGVFRIQENLNKLSKMKFDSNEVKLYSAASYEYECLEDRYIIVARNEEEAELLFENYIDEYCDDIEYSFGEESLEDWMDEEEYQELIDKFGNKEIGVYEYYEY